MEKKVILGLMVLSFTVFFCLAHAQEEAEEKNSFWGWSSYEIDDGPPNSSSPDSDPPSGEIVFTEVNAPSPDSDPPSGEMPFTQIDTLIVGGQYSDTETVKDVNDVDLGVPHTTPKYQTEMDAFEDSSSRSLGVPYSIETELQKKAKEREERY
jgi:hypothetical protein